jgi:phosphate starvation-inducible PhoH-like protein
MLGAIDGIALVHLGARDVVRHRIVADIVNAYERAESEAADRVAARASGAGDGERDRS